MCNFFSAIVMKNKRVLHLPNTDSHTDILGHFGIPDNEDNTEYLTFARIEYLPPDGNPFSPLDQWAFKIDQRITPEWWSPAHRSALDATLREYLPTILIDTDTEVIVDRVGIFLGGSAIIGELKNTRVRAMYDSSRVRAMYGSSQVRAMYGSSQVRAMYDSSQVDTMYDSSQVRAMYGSSQVRAMYGSSQVDTMYDSSQVDTMYDSSQVDTMYGSSQVRAMYGSSQVRAHNDTPPSINDLACIIRRTSTSLTLETATK